MPSLMKRTKSIDDYSLTGAISSTSGENKYWKNIRPVCAVQPLRGEQTLFRSILPFPCSQPVGITVQQQENNNTANPQKIWVAATWIGYLIVFDTGSQRFSDFIEIPNWKTKGTFGSMVWDMEFDKKDNLWFTDQVKIMLFGIIS